MPALLESIEDLAARILATPARRAGAARLVALSGIDASGKGTVARETAAALRSRGQRVALVGTDDWHTPAGARFAAADRARHFYEHAFDFEEVFSRVVEPVRFHRTLRLTVERPHPFGGRPRRLAYAWDDVDVVLLEGIFLFRRELRPRHDLAVWVDCAFETALERALHRNQEGLSKPELRRDYAEIYFPAQRLHLERDDPRRAADAWFPNDRDRRAGLARSA